MRQRIFKNVSANFFIKMITYVFSFAEVMYVTRIFQPGLYGRITLASTIAGYFVMLANLGMSNYATRTCAKKRDDTNTLGGVFNELWSIEVITAIVGTIAYSIVVFCIPTLNENRVLFLIYGCLVILQAFNSEWLFKGVEEFRFIAIISLICRAASFLFCILFVHSSENLLLYVCFSILGVCGSNLLLFLMRGKVVEKKLRFAPKAEHIRPLFTFFMMSCAVNIYASLDIVMLGFMKSEAEVGLYSIAAKGKSFLTLIGGLVWSSILPIASNLWKDGEKKRFELLAAKSLIIVSFVQTSAAVICFIFAKPIVMIIGGNAYLNAVPAFRVLLLSILPISVSNILGGQVLIPTGNEKKLLYAEIVGAVFNLLANMILIPRFSIIGVASTTFISEVIVWILCVYYCKKTVSMDFGIGLWGWVFSKLKRDFKIKRIQLASRISGSQLPYFCPCCNTYLKDFCDGGYMSHPDRYNVDRYKGIDQKVICPVCGSLPRHRILVKWMSNNKASLLGKEILYFAPEKSVMKWCNRNKISCTTADLFNDADLKLDIEDTGLADESYDIIVCNHVLEHVADYRCALKELNRIIRSDGFIILSFPVDTSLDTVYKDSTINSEIDRILYFGQSDHLRIFGRDSRELLENAGFKVSEISGDDMECGAQIKPVVGPADYDYNVLWLLTKSSTGVHDSEINKRILGVNHVGTSHV